MRLRSLELDDDDADGGGIINLSVINVTKKPDMMKKLAKPLYATRKNMLYP